METWEECHAAGLTAIDAAKAIGKSHVAAYKWAKKTGNAWRKLTTAEYGDCVRAGMGKSAAVPVQKPREKRVEYQPQPKPLPQPQPLPPAQDCIGGRFWVVNKKTGQRVNKSSAAAIYLHVNLMGWTDWDWGREP